MIAFLLQRYGFVAKDVIRLGPPGLVVTALGIAALIYKMPMGLEGSMELQRHQLFLTTLLMLVSAFFGLALTYNDVSDRTETTINTLPVSRITLILTRTGSLLLLVTGFWLVIILFYQLTPIPGQLSHAFHRMPNPEFRVFLQEPLRMLGNGLLVGATALFFSTVFYRKVFLGIAAFVGSILLTVVLYPFGPVSAFVIWISSFGFPFRTSIFFAVGFLTGTVIAEYKGLNRQLEDSLNYFLYLIQEISLFYLILSRPTLRAVGPILLLLPVYYLGVYFFMGRITMQGDFAVPVILASLLLTAAGLGLVSEGERDEDRSLLSTLPVSSFWFFYRRLITAIFLVIFLYATPLVYFTSKKAINVDGFVLFGFHLLVCLQFFSIFWSLFYFACFYLRNLISRCVGLFIFTIATSLAYFLTSYVSLALTLGTLHRDTHQALFDSRLESVPLFHLYGGLCFSAVALVILIPALTVFLLTHSPLRQMIGWRRHALALFQFLLLLAVAVFFVFFSPVTLLDWFGLLPVKEQDSW